MYKENTFKDWSAEALSHALPMAAVNPAVSTELLWEMREALAYRTGVETRNDYCAHGVNIYDEGLCNWCELGE